MGKHNEGKGLATAWQRWVFRPQSLTIRKLVFTLHLWSGLCLGLYIFFISVTGSVLVYRNELVRIFTPTPLISSEPSPLLTREQLLEQVLQSYPDARLAYISRTINPERAVELWFEYEGRTRKRFFDPRTAEDVGSAERRGLAAVNNLIGLHENFLAGERGRKLNGLGAISISLMVLSGLFLWWPGIRRWHQSLRIRTSVGWKRTVWDLHSMLGFWGAAAMLMFSVTGIYLGFPDFFHDWADKMRASSQDGAVWHMGDELLRRFSMLHFGRRNGIALACSGPGFCDQSFKALWALAGLIPAIMFVSGLVMWRNRCLRHLKQEK